MLNLSAKHQGYYKTRTNEMSLHTRILTFPQTTQSEDAIACYGEESKRQAQEDSFQHALSIFPKRFRNVRLDQIEPKSAGQKIAIKVLKTFVRHFRKIIGKKSTSIILTGKSCTGKTHFAVSIGIEILKFGAHPAFNYGIPSVFYATGHELYREVKAIFSAPTKEQVSVLKRYTKPLLLILDDITMQNNHLTPTERNILSEVILNRYNDLLCTIAITHLSLSQLKAVIGESSVNCLILNGAVLAFDPLFCNLGFKDESSQSTIQSNTVPLKLISTQGDSYEN